MARRPLSQIRGVVKRWTASSPQMLDADVDGCINDAHQTLAGGYQWSFRKRDAVLQTVAPYSAGTVSVTAGSSTITGSGTAWTAAMVGRQIRIAGEFTFFWIGAVNVGAQTLTLADGALATVSWVTDTAAGKSYTIFQDQFAVPATVAIILNQINDWPLTETSLAEIDLLDAQRTANGPPDRWYWARDNILSATEVRYVGLWPPPSAAQTLRMPYLIEPPTLSADTDLPVCPSEVIELGAGVRACGFLHARTGDQRWANQAVALHQMLYGTPGLMGVLHCCLQDDQHRFGLPTRLGGSEATIGADRWNDRDWSL